MLKATINHHHCCQPSTAHSRADINAACCYTQDLPVNMITHKLFQHMLSWRKMCCLLNIKTSHVPYLMTIKCNLVYCCGNMIIWLLTDWKGGSENKRIKCTLPFARMSRVILECIFFHICIFVEKWFINCTVVELLDNFT